MLITEQFDMDIPVDEIKNDKCSFRVEGLVRYKAIPYTTDKFCAE
jgi:hypothetical protein